MLNPMQMVAGSMDGLRREPRHVGLVQHHRHTLTHRVACCFPAPWNNAKYQMLNRNIVIEKLT